MNDEQRAKNRDKLLKIAGKTEFKFWGNWTFRVVDGKVYCGDKLADGHDLEKFDELLLEAYKPLTPQLKRRRVLGRLYRNMLKAKILCYLAEQGPQDWAAITDHIDETEDYVRTMEVYWMLGELDTDGMIEESGHDYELTDRCRDEALAYSIWGHRWKQMTK